MKFVLKIFIIIAIITISQLIGSLASADGVCMCGESKHMDIEKKDCGPGTDNPKCYWKEGTNSDEPESLTNPLGKITTPQLLIGQIINALLGIVGSLALLMFIYGGFIWMTAAGNQERVTKGRNVLMWAIIGLIIIFASYSLVNFIITDAIGAK